MDIAGMLSGGAPVIKKYQVEQSVDNIGIPLLASTTAEAGLDLPSATSVADMVGLNLDTAIFVTAQQTDGSSAERVVGVIINPDILIKARLSGSGVTGVALSPRTVTSVSTTGLVVTTGDDWSSPEMLQGSIWGYDGANARQLRKIVATDTAEADVRVAFDNDTVVGDRFLFANFWPADLTSETVTMTADFLELDMSVDLSTAAAELVPVELIAEDLAGEGELFSFAILLPGDHHFAPRPT